jgi:hypothetical protein
VRRPLTGHYTMGRVEPQATEARVGVARMMTHGTTVAPMSSATINMRQSGSLGPHEYMWPHLCKMSVLPLPYGSS